MQYGNTIIFQILRILCTQEPQTSASGDNSDQFNWSCIAYFNQKVVTFALLSKIGTPDMCKVMYFASTNEHWALSITSYCHFRPL